MTIARPLYYIANIRFPTEKAHGYQIARVVAAVRAAGNDITLVVPSRTNTISTPGYRYYGVDEFPLVTVRCPDLMNGRPFFDRIAFLVQGCIFAFRSMRYVPKGSVVLTRDSITAWLYSLRGRKVFFMAHKTQHSWIHRVALQRVCGIVANSEGTAAGMQVHKTPTIVLHNGADPNPYIETSQEELRRELNLPTDVRIALYSGHLYPWKGVGTLVAAAEHSRNRWNIVFIAIGGLARDVAMYRARAEHYGLNNILFLGHREKAEVAKYLAAADVLILPNSRTGESVEETSPLKLFEYLAAGRPIVASDLPSIRRIVSEESAFFVPPDDGAALAFAVSYAIEKKDESERRASAALRLAQSHTWEQHAARILSFIEENAT